MQLTAFHPAHSGCFLKRGGDMTPPHGYTPKLIPLRLGSFFFFVPLCSFGSHPYLFLPSHGRHTTPCIITGYPPHISLTRLCFAATPALASETSLWAAHFVFSAGCRPHTKVVFDGESATIGRKTFSQEEGHNERLEIRHVFVKWRVSLEAQRAANVPEYRNVTNGPISNASGKYWRAYRDVGEIFLRPQKSLKSRPECFRALDIHPATSSFSALLLFSLVCRWNY